MATVKGALALYDGMTGPLKHIHNALNVVLNSFEAVQDASENVIDVTAIQQAREELAQAGATWTKIEENIRDADQAQNDFNNGIREGTAAVDVLGNKLKGILATAVSIAGVKSALNWGMENFSLANTQRNAENQLKLVLANMGAQDVEIPMNTSIDTAAYNHFTEEISTSQITVGIQADATQTISAFDAIAAKASEIQGRGIYGDEAMIAGAAELATYFSDAEAIISMMDTLANYSMGMSGGGALDSKAVVDYATGIGKIMSGSYDAMTKKGFEFTDAQKAIIEGTATQTQIVEALGAEYLGLSSDMQAAAAINSVIAEAWDGLYDNMSNTPEGKMIQFNNTLGDLRETMGNRLYPAALHFFDVFTQKFPKIESVLTWFTDGLSAMVAVLTWIAALGLDVATIFTENWSWISPIIYGIAGAMLVYLAATKGVAIAEGIATTASTVYHAAISFLSIGFGILTGNTAAASAAVFTFNSALMASPITWVVIGVIALIAALYTATAAINHFAGTSVSATGIIAGAFAVLVTVILNNFVIPLCNTFTTAANFILNVFNDPVAAVKVLFYDMALAVVGYIKNMAEAIEAVINKIPGVTVDITSGLDHFYRGLEAAQQKVKDESGWVEYVQKMDFIDYRDVASAAYKLGQGIEDTVSGLFKMPTLDEMGFDFDTLGNNLDGIYGNTGDTAANTAATADALEYTEEDLKYLRDIAEREAINRYTTAEITVEQHNKNHISKDTDLDGIMDAWANDFAERLDISEEGVHE